MSPVPSRTHASASRVTNLRGHHHGNQSRAGSKRRAAAEKEAAAQKEREPSPPLTIDSIQHSFNPFPLFRFRWELLAELVLLECTLGLAIYRMWSVVDIPGELEGVPKVPIRFLALFLVLLPVLVLFRRKQSYFMMPFTDSRGYRDPGAADDGVAAAVIFPILLSAACYWDAYAELAGLRPASMTGAGGQARLGLEGIALLPQVWQAAGIQATNIRPNATSALLSAFTGGQKHIYNPVEFDPTPLEVGRTLLQARYQLVLLNTAHSYILLLHLALSRGVFRVDRISRSNTRRFFGFMGVSGGISGLIWMGMSCWSLYFARPLPLSPGETAVSTFIQQASYHIISRLGRRGFTLGELAVMASTGNSLCLEFWRMSRSRWLFKRGFPSIPPTFRIPTPIVVFQTVLIPGAFTSGFLLSPLLVISRHIAQKPSHRLKWPTERERHRKLLAAGVFSGLFGIVVFMLGGWAGWMLGGGLNRPWYWALNFAFKGTDGISLPLQRYKWASLKRCFLIAYWGATIVVAVGGWQTRLVRARRIRIGSEMPAGGSSPGTGGAAQSEASNGGGGAVRVSSKLGTNTASKVGVENAREEKRVHASLNMRRKFFHALAVAMFVPGIAIDPAFTSLAFSVAFALFTFSEYARYFALYPIGAQLHIFFNEFVDSKDKGPVILSHFYLLTGCAGGLWLEGRGVKRFTGVLTLGIGDSLASIVGKLFGQFEWPGTSKTVEGTLAFALSMGFSAWLMRLCGLTESFSLLRYLLASTLTALLEATSSQNDNVIIPIFMWSLLSLFNV